MTRNGALVYVGGPNLNITDLADLLVRAGAVRAMELDINTDWVNLATFDPSTTSGLASPANGTDLLPLADMSGATQPLLPRRGGLVTSSRCPPVGLERSGTRVLANCPVVKAWADFKVTTP